MLKQRPLCTTDFIDNLSLQDVTYKDDKLVRTCTVSIIYSQRSAKGFFVALHLVLTYA